MTKVSRNNFTRYFDCSKTIQDVQDRSAGELLLLYEIDPKLEPSFEKVAAPLSKTDSNYGIAKRY